MEWVLFAAIIILCLMFFFSKGQRYKRTSYYKITKNKFSKVQNDKGLFGEYFTYILLRGFERQKCRFLFNLYIPKGDDETTEIDMIMLSPKGVFVFEVKNYSGWIFGSMRNQHWTQVLPMGRGRESNKQKFLNPIKQNASHIKHLKNISELRVPVWSIVVFSDEATFKDILTDESVALVYESDLKAEIKSTLKKSENCLSSEDINDLYDNLFPYTQVSDAEKQKHIENISAHI